MVMVNTYAFRADNLNFMEIRRVLDKGPGCVIVNIKLSRDGAPSGMNLTMNVDNVDEAVQLYLDVLSQAAADQGRPIAEELLKLKAEKLKATLALPPKTEQGDAKMVAGENDTPLTESSKDGAGEASRPWLFTCLHCGEWFTRYDREVYCPKCAANDIHKYAINELESKGNEERSSQEDTGTGSEGDSQVDGEPGNASESHGVVEDVPFLDQTGEADASAVPGRPSPLPDGN